MKIKKYLRICCPVDSTMWTPSNQARCFSCGRLVSEGHHGFRPTELPHWAVSLCTHGTDGRRIEFGTTCWERSQKVTLDGLQTSLVEARYNHNISIVRLLFALSAQNFHCHWCLTL